MTNDDQTLLGALSLFALGFVLLVGVAGGCCAPSRAAAQVERPADLSRVELELAKRVARVSFNEALDSEPDLELVVQIVWGARETPEGRLRWLRSHSPCVSGRLTQDQAYARPGNCRWSRNLMTDGRRPRGWRRETDGHWSRTRPRWLAHLERVIEYVRGVRVAAICDELPTTWDGRRYGRAAMEARGFRVLTCRERTENFALVSRRRRGS